MLRFVLFCVIALVTSVSGRAQSELPISDDGNTQANGVGSVGQPKKAAEATIKNDVNNDGVVNAIDVVDIVKYLKGSPRSRFSKSKADVNGDGVVDKKDAEALSANLVGDEPASGPSGDNTGSNTGTGDNTGTGTGDDPGTDVGGGLNIQGGTLVNPQFP